MPVNETLVLSHMCKDTLKAYKQLSSGFNTLNLHQYLVYGRSEDSGEATQICRLVSASAAC